MNSLYSLFQNSCCCTRPPRLVPPGRNGCHLGNDDLAATSANNNDEQHSKSEQLFAEAAAREPDPEPDEATSQRAVTTEAQERVADVTQPQIDAGDDFEKAATHERLSDFLEDVFTVDLTGDGRGLVPSNYTRQGSGTLATNGSKPAEVFRDTSYASTTSTIDLTGEGRRNDVSGASYESAATTVDLTGGHRRSQTSCETAQSSQCSQDTHMSVDLSGLRKMSNTEVVKHSTLAEFITEEPCGHSSTAADVVIEPTVSVQRLSLFLS